VGRLEFLAISLGGLTGWLKTWNVALKWALMVGLFSIKTNIRPSPDNGQDLGDLVSRDR